MSSDLSEVEMGGLDDDAPSAGVQSQPSTSGQDSQSFSKRPEPGAFLPVLDRKVSHLTQLTPSSPKSAPPASRRTAAQNNKKNKKMKQAGQLMTLSEVKQAQGFAVSETKEPGKRMLGAKELEEPSPGIPRSKTFLMKAPQELMPTPHVEEDDEEVEPSGSQESSVTESVERHSDIEEEDEDEDNGDDSGREESVDSLTKAKRSHTNSLAQSSVPKVLAGDPESTEHRKAQVLPWYIINPTSQWKLLWDVAITGILLVLIIIVPFRIAFVEYERTAWDWFVDTTFQVDLVLTCFTAYHRKKSSTLEKRLDRILWKYFRTGRLAMDLLAAFPLDLILVRSEAFAASLSKSARVLRVVRSSKLAKTVNAPTDSISRLWLLCRYRKKGQELVEHSKLVVTETKTLVFYRLAKALFAIGVFAHLSACAWYWCGSLNDLDDKAWINRVFEGDPVANDTAFSKYLTSVYAMVTVLTTVGFGDITPRTGSELVYIVAMMLVGTLVFPILTAALTGILAVRDRSNERVDRHMRILSYYLNRIRKHLPVDRGAALQADILRAAALDFKRHDELFPEEEVQDVVESIPSRFRAQIAGLMHGVIFTNSPMLRLVKDIKKDKSFLIEFSSKLRFENFVDGDVIVPQKHDISSVYWIHRGVVDVLVSRRTIGGLIPAVSSYTVGMCFGDECLIDGNVRYPVSDFTYRARAVDDAPRSWRHRSRDAAVVVCRIAVSDFRALLEKRYHGLALYVARKKKRFAESQRAAYMQRLADLPEYGVQQQAVTSAQLEEWAMSFAVDSPADGAEPESLQRTDTSASLGLHRELTDEQVDNNKPLSRPFSAASEPTPSSRKSGMYTRDLDRTYTLSPMAPKERERTLRFELRHDKSMKFELCVHLRENLAEKVKRRLLTEPGLADNHDKSNDDLSQHATQGSSDLERRLAHIEDMLEQLTQRLPEQSPAR